MARGFETYGTGATDRVNLNHNVGTAYSTITLSAWMWVHTVDNYEEWFGTSAGSGGDYKFMLYTNTKFRISIPYSGGPADFRSNDGYSLDEWFHVAITSDGNPANDPVFYVNGVDIGIAVTGYSSGTISATGNDWRIGDDLDGKVAEFALFDRVLEVGMIKSLANGASPHRCNPNVYVPLVNSLYDRCNPDVLTVTGAPLVVDHPPGIAYPKQLFVGTPAPVAAAGSPWYHRLQQRVTA